MAEVVTLGESMVVFVPEAAGPLRHAQRFMRAVAGAEGNVAIGLSRLGHGARWISRLGDDEFGRYVAATLRGEGVDVGYVQLDRRAPTGIMFKERGPGLTTRVLYYRRGSAASLLDGADVPVAAIRGARWVHTTGITAALGEGPRRAVYRLMEVARSEGARVSFDPNYRPQLWSRDEARPVLLELAARADLLVFNEAEAELLFGKADPAPVLAEALGLGPSIVALKRAEAGAVVGATGADPLAIGPVPLPAVEPTGAGDAFAAGLLAGLLDGFPLERAARLAALCGALACTVLGDWEGAPERADVQRYLPEAAEWWP